MAVSRKKRFYNRVRRTCKLHDIEIRYDGSPKKYRGVELLKDGQVMFADSALERKPLDINWEKLHEQLADYGYKGGVK